MGSGLAFCCKNNKKQDLTPFPDTKYAGTGIGTKGIKGQPGYKEVVSSNVTIGDYVDRNGINRGPTKNFTVTMPRMEFILFLQDHKREIDVFDPESVQKNLELFETIKLGSVNALLGVIPWNLRAFGIGFDEKPIFVSIFDKEPSYEEQEDISCAITEVISHICIPVEEKYLTVPYPTPLGDYCPNWGWVYLRKEPVD